MRYINRIPYTLSALTISTIVIGFIFVIFIDSNKGNNNINDNLLIRSSESLITETERWIMSLLVCETITCINNSNNTLEDKIKNFESNASKDKNLLSLVGANEYTQLKLIINKHSSNQSTFNITDSLIPILIKMQKNHNEMILNQEQKNTQSLNTNIHSALTIFTTTLVILVFTILIIERKKNIAKFKLKNKNNEFDNLTEIIDNLEWRLSEKILNNLNINQKERQIYSKLKNLHDKVEGSKNSIDLCNKLYSMIGYEIRGISNTIKGGIELISKDESDKNFQLARDIAIATTTLYNLAENYNKLFSQGIKEKTTKFSFIKLLTELVVNLSAKNSSQHINIECNINNNLPNELLGNSTKLFWILFLQLSNAIGSQNKNNILINVDSQSAADIAESTIKIDLIFLTTYEVSLEKINKLHWEPIELDQMANDDWSSSLLDKINKFNTSWYQSSKQQKFEIKMNVTPISYKKESSSLENKFFLIYATTEIKIDIITKIFISHGSKIKIARTVNEIFKSLVNIALYDAVIITEDKSNINIISLCKNLHGRMKEAKETKLLLAANSSEVANKASQYVDQILYAPLIPDDFIPTLIKELESVTKEDDNEKIYKCLIVEDDKIQQFILKRILQQPEYETNIVGGGREAVDWVKNNQTDIIFMDCIMPGMGGLQATRLIRLYEQEQINRAPAIIIGATALTSDKEQNACLEAGMNYVISKPYKSDEILKSMKKYITINDKKGA